MTKSKYHNKRVTFTDRKNIEELSHAGLSRNQISVQTGFQKGTISRELKRCPGIYNADQAQLDADEKKIIKDDNNRFYRNRIMQRMDELEKRIQFLENNIKETEC